MTLLALSGMLKGLKHRYNQPLQYTIHIGDDHFPLNDYLGSSLELHFEGDIECVYCGRKINKTFNNGSCFPCFKSRPENDMCIVKPELCHFHEGTCRDESFGESHCMIPHYVYLALSSDVKVGITRKNNEMKRWGDQGAVQAFPIAEVPNRKTAGEMEIIIAEHINDKTNWRKMLKGDIADVDLHAVRSKMMEKVPAELQPYLLTEEEIVEFTYPILESLDKIKSYNLDKQPLITDRLIGVKGQYLILEGGVINMKKYAGYYVTVKATEAASTA